MQHIVSNRNIRPKTNGSGALRFNAEARFIDDPRHLLPLWPSAALDRSLLGRTTLIAALAQALRRERLKGRNGHPGYNLVRHASLSRMLKQERAALKALVLDLKPPRIPR